MYIKYVKYITCITCIIYSFSDYVDSDDEDPPIENRDDDGGPPQDQDPLEDSMRALDDQGSGPGPVRIPHSSNCAIGMAKAMQLAGGDTYIQAAIDADKRMGTDTAPLKVYSERCGGKARRAQLKRKASEITRSACETFAYCTSRTTSIEDTAMLLSAFSNVRDIFIFVYSLV